MVRTDAKSARSDNQTNIIETSDPNAVWMRRAGRHRTIAAETRRERLCDKLFVQIMVTRFAMLMHDDPKSAAEMREYVKSIVDVYLER